MEDIDNFDDNMQYHGFQLWYTGNKGDLRYFVKSNFFHGREMGYEECHYKRVESSYCQFYII